jgi:hypothetical protein
MVLREFAFEADGAAKESAETYPDQQIFRRQERSHRLTVSARAYAPLAWPASRSKITYPPNTDGPSGWNSRAFFRNALSGM